MQWGKIFGPTDADGISIIFGPVEICVKDSDWMKPLFAASPSLRNIHSHCIGHVGQNPVNVIKFGQCNGSNVITFEWNYICAIRAKWVAILLM